MQYEFLESSIDKNNIILPESDKIHSCLLKNNQNEIIKAVNFIDSKNRFLHIHGFIGTGKRQFINYIQNFLNSEVIRLEYYCKEGTVCDDILLSFINIIESLPISKVININSKITTLNIKFSQMISSIKKPFIVILHSLDDIMGENRELISDFISQLLENDNIKVIVSTRAMNVNSFEEPESYQKIFLKGFTKEIFGEFLDKNNVEIGGKILEDFYKHTRGYYYYTALSIKIMEAMKLTAGEFLQKFTQSGMSFDAFLSATYINLIPNSIRNFFWFLRTIRHGLTLNSLAAFELYDEFAINYLKTNLMIFQVDETLYVQDFFVQKIDISIPEKIQTKLHKYIIGIYEKQLKESVAERVLIISRQAMRAEIEYHNNKIYKINENTNSENQKNENNIVQTKPLIIQETSDETNTNQEIAKAINLASDKKFTEAIELLKNILDKENIDLMTVVEIRKHLARFYKNISEYSYSNYYYDLVKTYYKQQKEMINLNYLYYEMADLYYKMYKHERAIKTLKEVIFSVETPQSLLVNSCTLLGNIYSDINNPKEAYSYYQKALASLDENVTNQVLAELYFKYALANDDNENYPEAFEYYNKCIALYGENSYKASAYSNMASCYFENNNISEAKNCFIKAYEIEKNNNNYEGIYYNTLKIAEVLLVEKTNNPMALEYLLEAKKSAEFISEEYYILESAIYLGDYYYNFTQHSQKCLIEYMLAYKVAQNNPELYEITKIQSRIEDMRKRMSEEVFKEIEQKYGK